jgi:hypothetical protein
MLLMQSFAEMYCKTNDLAIMNLKTSKVVVM